MFVKCNKRVEIKGTPGQVFEMDDKYVGVVPEWVEKNWYFQACCKDGTIVYIDNKKDSTLEQADVVAKEQSKIAENVAAEKRVVDDKVNEAYKEAEKEAKELNLDGDTKKNLVKSKVEKAMKN